MANRMVVTLYLGPIISEMAGDRLNCAWPRHNMDAKGHNMDANIFNSILDKHYLFIQNNLSQ